MSHDLLPLLTVDWCTDTPGHASSWCKGHPEVCPSPTCTEPLNPATEATFDLLAGLFKDVTGGAAGKGIFPDNMFHLGRRARTRLGSMQPQCLTDVHRW